MQIDWLTVAAQIVNFLILVWLLKRLLYQPVVAAMTRREQQIAARLADAQRRESEATERARDYAEKTAALERSRQDRLTAATQEAETQKRQLLEQARAEVDEQRTKWLDALRREHEDLRTHLQRAILAAAIEIARRALTDLADAPLEDRMVATLLRRLQSMPGPERDALIGQNRRVRISSSFELAPENRSRLAAALGTDAIEYETGADVVCGLSLRGQSQKLEWNIATYIDGVGARIDTLVGAATTAEATA
ncbi:MAG TPA: F0F1 ATP synthase subunit B [Gammaproteobacteria bacterium]|jgi:F-type H+-transporting ATPase subunit b|nr:F0F1 ATP synthase subunit B [Gammaproteobacteria bacterium]